MEEPISLPREKVITYTPLVYNADTDFSTITNLLLVDNDVQDYNKFVENVNSSTFAITFSQGSKGQDIVDLLAAKLPSITRIAIVANDSMLAAEKRLFSYKPYFESSDLEMDTTRTSYSENLQLLIDLIKAHSVQTIDFLACNSLTFDNWESYYSILTKETGVTVGASSDQTGNILSGGDWTMESTGVDIEAIYFTSGISNYQGTLETTLIGGNVTLSMVGNGVVYSQDGGPESPITWPCTLEGTITVTLTQNLNLNNDANKYFIIANSELNDVTIDGNGYTIKVNGVPEYEGLVRSRSNKTTVKNIGLLSSGGTTLASFGGWIGQGDPFGILSFIGTIDNCYSTGDISGGVSGGIAGNGAGGEGGTCNITNCYSTGAISGGVSGGIAGGRAGGFGGNCTITNCHSTGAISGYICGGIAGGRAGTDGGNCTITNCYSTGAISDEFSGGIAGYNAGNSGICTITNCYSTGDISGDYSGGIAGPFAGAEGGTCTITGCHSTGAISGGDIGGIAGGRAGTDGGTCTITNCYSTGAISGFSCGGIAGASAGGIAGICTITNCYSTGGISGNGSGGIAGVLAGDNGGNCEISNCYSTGAISGNDSGGIAGSEAGTEDATCTITNCYTTGIISGTGSGGIKPAGSSAVVANSYHSNGWLDSTARKYLQNIGTVWKLIYTDSPWKLNVFLVDVTTNYNNGTLIYTSKFPINAYSNVLTARLLNNGVFYGPVKVTLIQNSITFNNVRGIANGSKTYLVLYDGSTLVDYANFFTITENICFKKGTMILTPNGYRAVESLNSGDLVKTAQGRVTKVQTVVSFTGKVNKCPLYVLKTGVLGANKPIADLYMSEGHAYRNRGYWCHMKCSSVAMKLRDDNIEYYNIVLDNYFEHTLVANGVEVESLFRANGLVMTWNCNKDHCKPIISLKK